jgi:flagellar hook-associated protein 2
MPTIQATGIGSGLDVNSLVSQLVSAERTPYATQLTSRETKATVQISALSSLKGALSTFKSAVDSLTTETALAPRSTTSSDNDVFTATSTGDAATGSYDVHVIALAQAQQLASGPFSSATATQVGTGQLTITFGSTAFNVDIDSSHNTPAGIRDAINGATGNTGVQATLLNETGGTRLVLSSAKTGAVNTIRVTQSGGDGGLAQLVYDPGNTTNLSEVQAAQDAHIRIATFDHYNATNTIDGVIDGVTLNLKTTSDTAVTLSVAEDTSLLKQRVTTFVQAYNALYASVSKLRSYDANSKAAGPLLGDALVRGIEGQIGLDLSNPVSGLTGAYTTLASIGVTRQADGTLAVSDAKLSAALAADRGSIARIFSSENGVAVKLSHHIELQLKTGAALDTRSQSLQKELKTISSDNDALNVRMSVVEARYRKQFTALDTLLAQLQTTSNYLTSQLDNLPKITIR